MLRRSAVGPTILLVLASACHAETTPRRIFEEAVRLDLDANTEQAFETYLKAAKLGLPEAEFNVAVMLDSGRGVRSNEVQAAVWYARAAAHGNQRAAYNLGLLYSSGEGVPRNEGISNAWFAASGLPASISRRGDGTQAKELGKRSTLLAPTPVAPEGGSHIDIANGAIEFVWTAESQPEAVHYVVEFRSTNEIDHYDTFSLPVATSSLVLDVPGKKGDYSWRVFSISKKSAQYISSPWKIFRISGVVSSGAASRF